MPIRCEIVSQDRMVFEGDADMVLIPGSQGEMGILPNHAPLLTTLNLGILKVRYQGVEQFFTIAGGIAEIQPDIITVLADAAEDAALLEDDQDRHEGPVDHQPVDPRKQARAGDLVDRVQRRLTPGDRVPRELDLRGDLDDAPDEDQPEQGETRLRAGLRGGDQLARADDGAGDDHARAEPCQCAQEALRRSLDITGRRR